jgi:2-phosphoglycerate kinase
MIYLVGGAPRAGKSVLCQQLAAKLNIGWISTDILMEVLRIGNADGIKTAWDADPEAITANAEWFFPYLERFIWGASSLADNYVVEGVDFLPPQAMQLSSKYAIRAVFLGCSEMTLEKLDQFPGRSQGYKGLPEALRRQIVKDVPTWSEFIQRAAQRFGYPYIETSNNFSGKLQEAEAILMTNI